MGSWEALDGLSRVKEQRHGSTRFSLDRTKKMWHTIANEKKAAELRRGRFQGECWWSDRRLQDQLFEFSTVRTRRVCHQP